MLQPVKMALKGAARIFSDRLLQVLLIGVTGAAFLFAFVLGADAPVVFGVLVMGCIAALVESAHHRPKK